jgi:hypothetical protein
MLVFKHEIKIYKVTKPCLIILMFIYINCYIIEAFDTKDYS